MTKSLVISIGLAVLLFPGFLSLNQNQYGIQKVSTQGDDQHFKDCRSRFLDMTNRFSKALDRYENGEDVRTEMSSVMSEGFVIFSDCADVRDRMFQDPAVKFQVGYINERLSTLGLGNATITEPEQDINTQLNRLVDFCMDKLPAGMPECDSQLREIVDSACRDTNNSLDACKDDKVDQYYRARSIE